MLTKEQMQQIIDYEIIVDCYDEYEQSLGWHCYLVERLTFPFEATATLKKRGGGTEMKQIKITGLVSNEEGFTGKDFEFEMEDDSKYLHPIAFSKLSDIKGSQKTMEALAIWKFWIGEKKW